MRMSIHTAQATEDKLRAELKKALDEHAQAGEALAAILVSLRRAQVRAATACGARALLEAIDAVDYRLVDEAVAAVAAAPSRDGRVFWQSWPL